MNTASISRLSGWCCVAGGTTLIALTRRHASLPEGCVGDGCLTHPMRGTATGEAPLGVVTAVLLGIAAVAVLVVASRTRPLGKLGGAALACAAGASAFWAASAVVTTTIDGDVPWMPLLVLPAVALFVAAAVLLGVVLLRAKLVPTWLAVAVVATASLLLLAYEQTALVLFAVPFGAVCVVLGLDLIFQKGRVLASDQPQRA